jgi:iron complex outermembrane receptor protein
MFGVAAVHDYGLASVKVRAAYGRGVRASRSTIHIAAREPKRTLANPGLVSEQQAGVEVGIDVVFGARLGLHLTRFDQIASNLIQTVTITNPYTSGSKSGRNPSWYQLQNVGEITNRGWESQASLALGPASLAGAATFVDSRVRKLAFGYTGDLESGDRMLAVPARTMSGTFSWSRGGLQLSSTLTRASDWINYDRLLIAKALIAAGGDARNLTGNKLRKYWTSYPGTTRLRSSASRDVWGGMTLTLTGENLLNYQSGEPDTITLVPGRTVTLGLKARF